ncbi:MAG: hypothetical protein ACK42L_10265, partial [Thermoanaerobaculum sp.]
QAFQALLQDAPNAQAALDNLGATFWLLAEVHAWKGEDPEPFLNRAQAALEQALRGNPQDVVALTNLAVCAMSRARHKLWHGQSADAELEVAENFLQKVQAFNPQEPTLATNQLRLSWLKMQQAQQAGAKTGALFEEGQRWEAAIHDLDSNPEALGLAAGIRLVHARQTPKGIRQRLFQQAAKLLGEALRQAPREPELLAFAAEFALCSRRTYLPHGLSLPELERRCLQGSPIHRAMAAWLTGTAANPPLETLAPGLARELAPCR